MAVYEPLYNDPGPIDIAKLTRIPYSSFQDAWEMLQEKRTCVSVWNSNRYTSMDTNNLVDILALILNDSNAHPVCYIPWQWASRIQQDPSLARPFESLNWLGVETRIIYITGLLDERYMALFCEGHAATHNLLGLYDCIV